MGSARSLNSSPKKKARRRLFSSSQLNDVPLFSNPVQRTVGDWLDRISAETRYDDDDMTPLDQS